MQSLVVLAYQFLHILRRSGRFPFDLALTKLFSTFCATIRKYHTSGNLVISKLIFHVRKETKLKPKKKLLSENEIKILFGKTVRQSGENENADSN